MAVTAFEGPAGTGKTYSLMDHLSDRLREQPLALHERVLALTFMHGARRRLDSRLREIDGLAGRYQAVTVDSLAWRLVRGGEGWPQALDIRSHRKNGTTTLALSRQSSWRGLRSNHG